MKSMRWDDGVQKYLRSAAILVSDGSSVAQAIVKMAVKKANLKAAVARFVAVESTKLVRKAAQ